MVVHRGEGSGEDEILGDTISGIWVLEALETAHGAQNQDTLVGLVMGGDTSP